MPYRCVDGGCSNVPDSEKNIGLHKFPEETDRKRRRQWVSFVRTKRAKWSPTKNSRLCSDHFREDEFDNQFVQIHGTPFANKRVLKSDAVPTIHKELEEKPEQQQQQPQTRAPRTSREHRRVVRDLLKDQPILPSASTTEPEELETRLDDPMEGAIVEDLIDPEPVAPAQENLQLTRDDCTQTPECLGCKKLLSQNRQLRNKLIDVENKWKKRLQRCEEEASASKTPVTTEDEDNENVEENDEEKEEIIEEEPPLSEMSSPEYQMFSDTETETETEDDSDDEKPKKKFMHIVAATHFNYNLQRKVKTDEDGTEKVTIVYPKFKNGEAIVRSVRVQPNYDYIDRIYNLFIEAQNQKNLLGALEELNAMTPAPMNTMLEKQSRQDAVGLWKKRKSMVVQEVPGTALNEAERAEGSTRAGRAVESTTTRAQPRCRICKNPMKNHKNVKDCPKNRKA